VAEKKLAQIEQMRNLKGIKMWRAGRNVSIRISKWCKDVTNGRCNCNI